MTWTQDLEKLRYDYTLTSTSVVMDVGAYMGTWSKEIQARFHCFIHAFEPVSTFYKTSSQIADEKTILYPFGLGAFSRYEHISLNNDGSSIYTNGPNKELIKIRCISEILEELKLSHIDLIKINPEGSEYEILEHLISKNLVQRFDNIQVQFHRVVPNYMERWQQIRSTLMKTHYLTYDYPFDWENYQIRGTNG